MTFTVDGDQSCQATVRLGRATCSLPAVPVGQHPVDVAYSGDQAYAVSTGNLTVTIQKRRPGGPR